MATNVDVPSVGESVTEAILLKWHKQPGERVEVDEPICELETDKANVDLPAPGAGFLKILAEEGATVGVGETIAVLQDTGEGLPSPGGNGAGKPAPAKADGPAEHRPAVRNLLEQHGLDPKLVPGTGPGGSLTKEDVEKYLRDHSVPQTTRQPSSVATVPDREPPARKERTPPAKPPPNAPAAPRPVDIQWTGTERREPMSKLRKRIASRLVVAQQETAMLTTFNEIDLGEVKALRARYKEDFQVTHGVKLGFMSFFAKAVTMALQEFPTVNAFIDGDEVVFHDYVNLGIAVSTDRGLVVPVIKHVEKMSLAQIESEIKRVALAARSGKLGLDEMSGGTFTVTNGGIFGSLMSTPILNRPQSGILGMHAIQDRPVARDGQVVVRPMMYVALSYDHRIIDGRQSVSFLVRLKESLEDPARMLLQI